MKSSVSDRGSSSSLPLSSTESQSMPPSPSLKDVSYTKHLQNQHNIFRADTSIHSPHFVNAFPLQRGPVNSESHPTTNQISTKNPPGLSQPMPIDPSVTFSPLSYGLSLPQQDVNSRGAQAHSSLNHIGFIGQPNPNPSLKTLGSDHSLSGIPLPINRHAPIRRTQNRPPGIQEPELSDFYVDEAATLRLSGLYDEADELISGSPVASSDLLSGINKPPPSTWSSLIGNTNQGVNTLSNAHLGLENLWSNRNPPLSSSTSIMQPPSAIPPNALTHQQFLQMQSSGAFSAPSALPGFPGISPISLTGPVNQPIGLTADGSSAWPSNRFFDSTL